MRRLLSALTVTASLFCVSSVAQSRFCIGGDLEKLTAAEKASCSATMQTVRNVAAALHAPQNWHFVVVCGEQGWKNYAAFATGEENSLQNVMADTQLEQHETFFRQSRMQPEDLISVRKAVAHEVAGILLGSKDENAILAESAKLLSQDQGNAGI